jgi:hypothetical protein
MTDTPPEVEAGRAIAAAWDALNSPEHKADAESLRDVSKRVSTRVEAFKAAQNRLHEIHAAACASGTPAADNTEAADVINGDEDIEDLTHLFAEDDDENEFETASAHGALS